MTTQTRFTRGIAALLLCCAMLVPSAVSASAAPDHTASSAKVKAKVKADLLDTKVKVNSDARIQGRLDLVETGARGLELIVVQRLTAGVWVDVLSGSCRPNATFRLNVSFSIAAQYTLRVFYPGTTLSTAASSDTFTLTVLG